MEHTKENVHTDSWVSEHIKSCIFPIEAGEQYTSRCIDGRYEGTVPPLATPGADAGLFMNAFGMCREMEMNPISFGEQIARAVLATVGGIEQFHFHTDEHATKEQKRNGMGCGHLKQSLEHSDRYSLQREDVLYIFSMLKDWTEQGAHEQVLSGNHGEKAVVIVESPSHSVLPRNGNQQVFVFHKTLHHHRLDAFAEHLFETMNMIDIDISVQDVKERLSKVSLSQLQATVRELAPNLPVYNVTICENGTFNLRTE